MATVTVLPVVGSSLYYRFPYEPIRQQCFVELDCETGELSAGWNRATGLAVPMRVVRGHSKRWWISALRPDVANALLARIVPLAGRVRAGYRAGPDVTGFPSNLVAKFTDDADAAAEEIEELCEEADEPANELRVEMASVWLAETELEITAATTDAQLSEIEARVIGEAAELDVVDGLVEYLRGLRDEARAASREGV
jgi:hypothetical protein